ncbi:Uncharacterised protein [uncultured archaeon]|nr:Uncharacterised protein [uncultured archaeon]
MLDPLPNFFSTDLRAEERLPAVEQGRGALRGLDDDTLSSLFFAAEKRALVLGVDLEAPPSKPTKEVQLFYENLFETAGPETIFVSIIALAKEMQGREFARMR